ncbi:histone lysine-specific demethylase lsd1 bhc110 kdma1a [Cystoisospora suis]|uniref:Histone lysine-specific demethylase lsd1 bhc110 kdma1a n=1 Tax=Cystoisospora suis TaxID=483139 RepID=A0A2C6K1G3_9APIC|nr:histone lysine-specific demethylase lsd1 bhc110 kdma1a [Cystoisospora suis]
MRPFPSTAHGACLSGRREARRIIDWCTGIVERHTLHKWFYHGEEGSWVSVDLNDVDGAPSYYEDFLQAPTAAEREEWFAGEISCAFCGEPQTFRRPFIGCVSIPLHLLSSSSPQKRSVSSSSSFTGGPPLTAPSQPATPKNITSSVSNRSKGGSNRAKLSEDLSGGGDELRPRKPSSLHAAADAVREKKPREVCEAERKREEEEERIEGDRDSMSQTSSHHLPHIRVAVHEDCCYHTPGVMSDSEGCRWFNIGRAVLAASTVRCAVCHRPGASSPCSFSTCPNAVHLPCAQEALGWPLYHAASTTASSSSSSTRERAEDSPLPPLRPLFCPSHQHLLTPFTSSSSSPSPSLSTMPSTSHLSRLAACGKKAKALGGIEEEQDGSSYLISSSSRLASKEKASSSHLLLHQEGHTRPTDLLKGDATNSLHWPSMIGVSSSFAKKADFSDRFLSGDSEREGLLSTLSKMKEKKNRENVKKGEREEEEEGCMVGGVEEEDSLWSRDITYVLKRLQVMRDLEEKERLRKKREEEEQERKRRRILEAGYTAALRVSRSSQSLQVSLNIGDALRTALIDSSSRTTREDIHGSQKKESSFSSSSSLPQDELSREVIDLTQEDEEAEEQVRDLLRRGPARGGPSSSRKERRRGYLLPSSSSSSHISSGVAFSSSPSSPSPSRSMQSTSGRQPLLPSRITEDPCGARVLSGDLTRDLGGGGEEKEKEEEVEKLRGEEKNLSLSSSLSGCLSHHDELNREKKSSPTSSSSSPSSLFYLEKRRLLTSLLKKQRALTHQITDSLLQRRFYPPAIDLTGEEDEEGREGGGGGEEEERKKLSLMQSLRRQFDTQLRHVLTELLLLDREESSQRHSNYKHKSTTPHPYSNSLPNATDKTRKKNKLICPSSSSSHPYQQTGSQYLLHRPHHLHPLLSSDKIGIRREGGGGEERKPRGSSDLDNNRRDGSSRSCERTPRGRLRQTQQPQL